MGRWCTTRRSYEQTGHPVAATVRWGTWKPYVDQAHAFITQQEAAGHPGVTAALQWCAEELFSQANVPPSSWPTPSVPHGLPGRSRSRPRMASSRMIFSPGPIAARSRGRSGASFAANLRIDLTRSSVCQAVPPYHGPRRQTRKSSGTDPSASSIPAGPLACARLLPPSRERLHWAALPSRRRRTKAPPKSHHTSRPAATRSWVDCTLRVSP